MKNKKGEYIKRFADAWLKSARLKGKVAKLSKARHGKVLVELSFEGRRKQLKVDAREVESTDKRMRRFTAQLVKQLAKSKRTAGSRSHKLRLKQSNAVREPNAVNEPSSTDHFYNPYAPDFFVPVREKADSSDGSVSDTVPPGRRPPKN